MGIILVVLYAVAALADYFLTKTEEAESGNKLCHDFDFDCGVLDYWYIFLCEKRKELII